MSMTSCLNCRSALDLSDGPGRPRLFCEERCRSAYRRHVAAQQGRTALRRHAGTSNLVLGSL